MKFKDTELGKRILADADKVIELSNHPGINVSQLEKCNQILEHLVALAEECTKPQTAAQQTNAADATTEVPVNIGG